MGNIYEETFYQRGYTNGKYTNVKFLNIIKLHNVKTQWNIISYYQKKVLEKMLRNWMVHILLMEI